MKELDLDDEINDDEFTYYSDKHVITEINNSSEDFFYLLNAFTKYNIFYNTDEFKYEEPIDI